MSQVSPAIFSFFSKIIYTETGILYKENNKDALEKRLKELAEELKFDSVSSFWQECSKNLSDKMKQTIVDKATNNETSFFRDSKVFKSLQECVLSKLCESINGTRPIRIWSSACSMGQEPYTIAILMTELKKRFPNQSFEIIASDISTEAISFASKGIYRQMDVQRGLAVTHLVGYFSQTENQQGVTSNWKIKDPIKKAIKFYQHNLLNSPSLQFGKFDVVLCRNVLIYFDMETREKILKNLMSTMTQNAFLLLGAAEGINSISKNFDVPEGFSSRIYKLKDKLQVKAA